MNLEPLMDQIIEKMPKGQYPSINKADIESLQIPVPPIEIQKKIISECEAIDKEYATSRMTIETYRKRISEIFDNLEVIDDDFVQPYNAFFRAQDSGHSFSFLDMIIKKYENKMNKLVESKILEEVKLNEANS